MGQCLLILTIDPACREDPGSWDVDPSHEAMSSIPCSSRVSESSLQKE